MKHSFLFLAGSLLLAGAAQAQTTFSVGPRVGFNISSAHFPTNESVSYAPPSYASRSGFEAGLTSTLQFGHFAVQPSLLFSQQGYRSSGFLLSFDMLSKYEEDIRLNYLTLPLNLAFTLGRDGQGPQIFAGPYASLLVGGRYSQQASGFDENTGKIRGANQTTDFRNWYARRIDGGLQAGVGYRLKGLQLQASYRLGLRNVMVPREGAYGRTYDRPDHYNRSLQVSLSYLVSTRS